MKIEERAKTALKFMLKESLVSFIKRGFQELNPHAKYLHNWHIEELCNILIDTYYGKKNRVIINMPPRYLKSICVSVCFPAWILGRDPSKRIIVASYSMALAIKHSIDTKKIMQSKWYLDAFPDTAIIKGQNQKSKFVTTAGGFRLAASCNGSLTGEGGDILIVDDPHKPLEIESKIKREKVINWFENTFSSRLNNKKVGGILIVMQRLHVDDLTGYLLARSKSWHLIKFTAIAVEDEKYRKAGDPLHEEREGVQDLKLLRQEIGDDVFEAQYQQSPKQDRKNLISSNLIIYIEQFVRQEDDILVFSIDSASKVGFKNDFTVIMIWVINGEDLVIYDILRIKLEFGDLLKLITNLITSHNPKFVLIEDASSGIALIQELKRFDINGSKILGIKSRQTKFMRFIGVVSYFEMKRVKFCKNINALNYIIEEVTSFPNSKNDDVIDAISIFLIWYSKNFAESKLKLNPRLRRL